MAVQGRVALAFRADRELSRGMRDLTTDRGVIVGNLLYLASCWAVIAIAIAVVIRWPSVPVAAVAFVVVASRQQALLNIEHECVHANFVSGKKPNTALGSALSGAPCGSPFQKARARHLAHHRLLGTDLDPDGSLHRGDDKRSRLGLLSHFGLGLLGGYAIMVILKPEDQPSAPLERKAKIVDLLSLVAAQGIIAAFLLTLGPWWTYPVLWLTPLVTLTTFCHLLRNFTEHALLPEEETVHPSRLITVRSNPLERSLVAPFNMNYHAEHHLFPFVPARRLPEVRRRLHDEPTAPSRLERASYMRMLVGHWRARL